MSGWRRKRKIRPILFALALALFSASMTPSRVFSFEAQEEKKGPPGAENVEAHVGKGYELVQDSRYADAAREFQAALTLDPTLERVRYQLGVCFFAMQQWKEARQEFERLLRESVADPAVVYHLARLDLTEDNLDSAIARFRSIAADPPFDDTTYYLGFAYWKKGKLVDAEKWLKKAAQATPRDFRVPDHLARVYMKEGRRAEAEQQFALSAASRQRYNDASHEGVDCAHALDSQPFQEARPTCQKLFDPNDPDRLVTLGMLYGQFNHYREAQEAFQRAVELDPDSFEIQHNLGLSLFRLQRYAEAREPLEKAVALRPDYFGSNALLGASLYAMKEDDAAYRVLDHAHQLNPQDADTAGLLFNVSVLLAEKRFLKKQYADCLLYLQKAAQLRPEDPKIHQQMADVYGLLGNRDQAERERRAAERLRGN